MYITYLHYLGSGDILLTLYPLHLNVKVPRAKGERNMDTGRARPRLRRAEARTLLDFLVPALRPPKNSMHPRSRDALNA